MNYFVVVCLSLACLSLSNGFCWGGTDSQGHCTGLGTTVRDWGYEPYAFTNAIAYGMAHRDTMRAKPPTFDSINRMYETSRTANQWNLDYSKRWGIR
jgi:hypothetical protein